MAGGRTDQCGDLAISLTVERALEVRVGRAQLLLPLERVARVTEIPFSPLPLARPLVLGLGFDDDRPVVCVSLTRPAIETTVITVVLLATTTRVGWALRVDEVFRLVSASQLGRGEAASSLPPWVGRARAADGRILGWIDADRMMRALAEPEQTP